MITHCRHNVIVCIEILNIKETSSRAFSVHVNSNTSSAISKVPLTQREKTHQIQNLKIYNLSDRIQKNVNMYI